MSRLIPTVMAAISFEFIYLRYSLMSLGCLNGEQDGDEYRG